jgi:purine-binding chemotaxis protein CheW
MQANEQKYLCFRLGGENYGIEILKVREIIGVMDITALPQANIHICGVINLRGKIVPVMDMRSKFALPAQERLRENCIITVMAESPQGSHLVGILVDSVSEVMKIAPSQIEGLPAVSQSQRKDYFLGLAKTPAGVTILLDIDNVILSAGQSLPEAEETLVAGGIA